VLLRSQHLDLFVCRPHAAQSDEVGRTVVVFAFLLDFVEGVGAEFQQVVAVNDESRWPAIAAKEPPASDKNKMTGKIVNRMFILIPP